MNPASLATKILTRLIRIYQKWISPLLGPHCRYTPTCSAYSLEAIHTHGLVQGSWLALRRILRCRPGCPGGHDPVPPKGRG